MTDDIFSEVGIFPKTHHTVFIMTAKTWDNNYLVLPLDKGKCFEGIK